MKNKKTKKTETKKTSLMKAISAQGMPESGNPVDISDNVLGEEADAYFGSVNTKDSKKKMKKRRLKKNY